MGNYGKTKIAAKAQAMPVLPKLPETVVLLEQSEMVVVSAVESDAEMIRCDLFPDGPVEKPIAFYRRNAQCQKSGCDRCL